MVLVNSVILVRGMLGLSDVALAWTMFAFGFGSMIAAFVLPRVLDRMADRPVMLAGAGVMVVVLLILAAAMVAFGLSWPMLMAAWLAVGFGYSAVLTPSGRLLHHSAHAEDRPAAFTAQFALSHASWLLCYPLAGWLMTWFGAVTALLVLALVAAFGIITALRLWPASGTSDLQPCSGHRRSASKNGARVSERQSRRIEWTSPRSVLGRKRHS